MENPSQIEDQAETSTQEKLSPAVSLVMWSVVILVLSQVIRADVPLEWKPVLMVFVAIAILLFLLGTWSLDRKALPIWLEKPIQVGKLGDAQDAFIRHVTQVGFTVKGEDMMFA